MSPLITWPEQIPAGTWAVKHARCGTRLRVPDDLYDLPADGAGKLLCEECDADGGRGSGYGFIVIARPAVGDELPPALANRWAASPHALWDYGHQLGLTAHDRLVACAIWRHQSGGGRAYPPREQLARETGLSVPTVKRAVSHLERCGLLWVSRERRAGRQLANEYDLSPLWAALARVAEGRNIPAPRVPQTRGPGVPQTRQVEPEQVEPAEAGTHASGATLLEFGSRDESVSSWMPKERAA